MGSPELLNYFKDYAAVKAKHSYGPKGHRGRSVLIFDSSAMGYGEAERLHKHFLGEGTGRSSWEKKERLCYIGEKRLLYGFLPTRSDLEDFNKHMHKHNHNHKGLLFNLIHYDVIFIILSRKFICFNHVVVRKKTTEVRDQVILQDGGGTSEEDE